MNTMITVIQMKKKISKTFIDSFHDVGALVDTIKHLNLLIDESDDIELMQRRQWRPLVKEIASQADSAIVLSGIALCWNDKVACSE